MKLPQSIYVLLLVLSISCAKGNNTNNISFVSEIWLHDIANTENSSDLKVVFELEPENTFSDYRIYIAKENPATIITQELLESLSEDAYTEVNVGDNNYIDLQLKANQKDTDGDLLTHDQAYIAIIYTVDNGSFAESSESFDFTENAIFSGSYRGIWGDNLFSDIPISIEMTGNGGENYKASVYISSNFQPTYGASDNNGRIDLTIMGSEILNFKYSQVAPDYEGGCPGLYQGYGEVDNLFNLKIYFTGNDCDGYHEDGLMEFSRVWTK